MFRSKFLSRLNDTFLKKLKYQNLIFNTGLISNLNWLRKIFSFPRPQHFWKKTRPRRKIDEIKLIVDYGRRHKRMAF